MGFRIAAIGDLHCQKKSAGQLAPLLAPVNDNADVLVLCGDLTDYGTVEEAKILVHELTVVKIPIIGVLGNHDFEHGCPDDVTKILCDVGVKMLDGDSIEVKGVGFAGVKGFIGGFGRGTLGPWGEPGIKSIVKEVLDEALKLESALGRLRTERRVALLHYAPIAATIEGEPIEIFPYLGCGRLEEPFLRYPVDAIFHGHVHHGSPEGKTAHGIPVYNVAMPLMMRTTHKPFRIVDIGDAGSIAAA